MVTCTVTQEMIDHDKITNHRSHEPRSRICILAVAINNATGGKYDVAQNAVSRDGVLLLTELPDYCNQVILYADWDRHDEIKPGTFEVDL